MGKAVDWQTKAIEFLVGRASIIFNPRRNDWDSTWEQKIENPQFNVQVNWELDKINESDIVIVNIDPNTMSPITLMELGFLCASAPHKTHVCCPEGFWRKGNVDIICERNGVKTYDSIDDLITALFSSLPSDDAPAPA
jgi:hypothetical protein